MSIWCHCQKFDFLSWKLKLELKPLLTIWASLLILSERSGVSQSPFYHPLPLSLYHHFSHYLSLPTNTIWTEWRQPITALPPTTTIFTLPLLTLSEPPYKHYMNGVALANHRLTTLYLYFYTTVPTNTIWTEWRQPITALPPISAIFIPPLLTLSEPPY